MNTDFAGQKNEEATVFNENELLEKLGGDREFFVEIVHDFLEDTERILGETEQALSVNDRETAERSAHSIKGSAANISATALSRAALRVEKAVRERRLGAATKLFPEMKEEFKKLKEVLEQI